MAKWKCEICGNEFDNFHAQGFDNRIYCPLCYFKKENQELKSQLKGTTHCFDEEEHEKLKKQLEKLQEEYIEFQEKASDIQSELRDDRDNYYERLQDKYREQKEFIEWLEDKIQQQETLMAENQEKLYFLIYEDEKENLKLSSQKAYTRRIILEEILQKYRSIIGVSDEKK